MEAAVEQRLREALERELSSLDAQLADHGVGGAGDTEGSVSEGGFADSAQVSAERSETIGLIEQLRANRAEVVAALERMGEGTYGICEQCGREIALERLDALPSTRLCVSCKQTARS